MYRFGTQVRASHATALARGVRARARARAHDWPRDVSARNGGMAASQRPSRAEPSYRGGVIAARGSTVESKYGCRAVT